MQQSASLAAAHDNNNNNNNYNNDLWLATYFSRGDLPCLSRLCQPPIQSANPAPCCPPGPTEHVATRQPSATHARLLSSTPRLKATEHTEPRLQRYHHTPTSLTRKLPASLQLSCLHECAFEISAKILGLHVLKTASTKPLTTVHNRSSEAARRRLCALALAGAPGHNPQHNNPQRRTQNSCLSGNMSATVPHLLCVHYMRYSIPHRAGCSA